jgi:hypothetical protein
VQTITGAKTLASGDTENLIRCTNSLTVTVPNLSVSNRVYLAVVGGSTVVTITPASGVTTLVVLLLTRKEFSTTGALCGLPITIIL